MSTRQKKHSRVRGVIFPIVALCLSAYFSYHSISGRYGLNAHQDADALSLHLQYRLAEYQRQRETLARRVSLLKAGSIEKDMLDQQARYHLNLLHKDEIVVPRQ